MSLTRKASSLAKKPTKPPRPDLAKALAEREAELAQARREWTATSEILQVIASSPGDLQPVLDKIAETACRLCKAYDALVLLREGDQLRPAAHYGPIPVTFASQAISRGLLAGRAVIERRAIHIDDIAKHADEYPVAAALASGGAAAGGMLWRANLVVPLMREGEAVGAIGLRRAEPAPFSEGQIELLKTFSHQAVVAIENARLFRETQQALERQTATAEVLKVIASSPSDVQPVFEAIAATANRLLGGLSTTVWRFVDEALVLVAFTRTSPAADEALQAAFPRPIAEFPPFVRARDGATGQVIDTEAELGVPQVLRDLGRLRGFRSMLFGPLMNDGAAIGMISVTRREPGAFVPADVQLLQTFADQAVIAIENARLFRETQESLRQQTATSDILRVIASSPGDLQPVLDRLAETTCRLCEANDALLFLREGGDLRLAAHHGPIPTPAGFVDRPISRDWVAGRSVADREPIHVHDLAAASDEYPLGVSLAKEAAGAATPGLAWRTTLSMPLIRESEAVGAITLRRVDVWPFTDAQIALLRTFADQAVIAIENARLFDEVQARTREVEEALEQQTATAEVLQVVSSSMADAQPVLDKILESCDKLFRSTLGMAISLMGDDDLIHLAAIRSPADSGDPAQDARLRAAVAQVRGAYPIRLSDAAKAAVQRIRHVIASADVLNEPNVPYGMRAAALKLGFSYAQMMAPLFAGDRYIGNIVVSRQAGDTFTAKEQALLKTFADQAVIAIQNARLFNETREALERQTATADILKVIASSPTDVRPVFDAIATSANRLLGGLSAAVIRIFGDAMSLAAFTPVNPAADEALVAFFPRPLDAFPWMELIRGGEFAQIPDTESESALRELARLRGYRSMLFTPLMSNGVPIGVITVTRKEPGRFAAHHVQLLQTFADQAVIAIENVRLFDEVQAKTHDLEEALQQQTATADVLKVISRSAFDLPTVLHTLVESAAKLCDAEKATITREIGGLYYRAEWYGFSDEFMREYRDIPVIPERGTISGRALLEGAPIHVDDVRADPEYTFKDTAKSGHFRTCLAIPMLRNGAPIGVLVMFRNEVRPFNARQIELVQTFADQAVIAIENVRLFDEVQAKTRDLEEALQQQTATADVLKAISRSAFDLDVVLETLVSTAGRLCGASHSQIFRRHGDVFRYATSQMDVAPAYREYEQSAEIRAGRGTLIGRVALEERAIEIADAWNDPEYTEKDQARVGDVRAMLGVPLMRNGVLVGAFALARAAPVPFTKRQVDLVTTFADQAVIAIENVRLFDEVQAKTRDLEEALEHQTATSEVLSAISRSPTEVQPVFDAIARSATELCGATSGGVDRFDGELIHLAAHYNWTPEALAAMRQIYPATPGRGFASARAILTRSVVHIPDISLDPEYTATAVVGVGFRSVLAVPMLRDGEPIGAIALVRLEPRAFTARQVALLQTFAEQAVIAINNVRLFDEVQARTRQVEEALAQQTATADVLKVISRSAFDLQTVLDTLAASAAGLLGANFAAMYLKRGDVIRADATFGASPEMVRFMNEHPQSPSRTTIAGRVFQTGEVQNVPDVQEDPEYDYGEAPRLANFRALLGVPMFRDGKVEGSFTLGRAQPGPFTRRQIELVQTFADQAVIAIENVRLFDEVQARTKDLEESLQQQTATANVLKVISRSAFDLDAVLKTLSDSARSLSNAVSAVVMLRDGDVLRLRAESGCDPQFLAYMAAHPTRAGNETLTGRVFLRGEAVSIPDALADPDYNYGAAPQLNNYRALLGAPLIRDGKVEGVFGLMHPKPGGFTPRQMELVRTFADQAVIAIENARLLDEVQARTRDIEEALQQQTATADVLKVISRSTFDLQPVLDTLVESAARLCDTEMAFILRRDGEVFRAGAAVGYAPEYMAYLQSHPLGINRGSVTGRVALEGRIVQIADVTTDPEYTLTQTTSLTGQRTALGVPLIRDGEVIGVIVLARRRVEAFTERQIELVTTFADQAVIAISNVGLFNETQEALKQQTATADVLKVISRSAFDLQTVLETLITTAVELNEAHSGTVCVRDGDVFRYRAFHSARDTREVEAYLRRGPVEANRGSIAGRTILSGQVEQIPDLLEDAEYTVPLSTLDKPWRAVVGVPMLGKTRLEGVFTLTRLEPGPYSPRQIEILQTFADQAVIAIENARLFGEVQARTKELAASLDDLQKAQDRLIQSEKLASLGQLTAGIAHEIKNPLNFINNFSALSRELIGELAGVIRTAPLDGGRREEAEELIGTIDGNLDKVVQHGKRADSIVKNMLLHSREGSGERSTTNINAMVEEALNLAYHGARAEKPGFNVTMAKSLDPNAGAAEVYAQEISRVLLNLISNGFYATTKRKQAEGNGSYEPTLTASTRDLGNSVEIAIRDNGTGISDAVKARMFNPFFTTKPAGEGTGLGLSLSHDIVVKQHGGTLEVSTEPGSYTQFTIVLPRANLLPPTPLPPGEEGS